MLAPSRDYDVAAPFWRSNPAAAAALAVAIVGAATIAGAWFFELVLKLRPCPLCLEQRVPYYIGIPLRSWSRLPHGAGRRARSSSAA
jgi:Disulfide bond formation protein DsbB